MVQNLYKTDSWFQKLHEEFGQLQANSGKTKKVKCEWLLLSKIYILSAKTYTEGLTLLSSTFVNIHQISYVSFETISHFSQHHSSVFFSSNITYFQQK